jgi:membrane protease subunit HflK
MSPDPSHHDHDHEAPQPQPAATPLDPGSQALADALRSSFFIVKIVMVILLVAFLGSGFYTVGPQERAIVLRFGKTVGEGEEALRGPGPHLAFPYPIDEVVRVPISEIQSVRSTVGWFFTTPEEELAGAEPLPRPSLNPGVDGYLITADQNIIHSRATLFYRIDDPVAYVFSFTGASNLVQNALDNALVEAAGSFKVDAILVSDVAAFKEAVRRRVGELLAVRALGVTVEQVEVESRPPLFLKQDFAQVTDAAQQRDKLINEARNYENQTISRAEADAASSVNQAESERKRMEESIRAEADRFEELLPTYGANPELFVQLQLSEALSRSLDTVQDAIYVQERSDGQPRELRLLLNRLPPKQASPEAEASAP